MFTALARLVPVALRLQLELEPLGAESLPQHCTLLRFRPKKS